MVVALLPGSGSFTDQDGVVADTGKNLGPVGQLQLTLVNMVVACGALIGHAFPLYAGDSKERGRCRITVMECVWGPGSAQVCTSH